MALLASSTAGQNQPSAKLHAARFASAATLTSASDGILSRSFIKGVANKRATVYISCARVFSPWAKKAFPASFAANARCASRMHTCSKLFDAFVD